MLSLLSFQWMQLKLLRVYTVKKWLHTYADCSSQEYLQLEQSFIVLFEDSCSVGMNSQSMKLFDENL